MDSRLLNAYHDENPYECYENNVTDIWSTDNIEMELEHTLDGILPIRATEVENEAAFCNVFYADDHMFGDKENNTNVLMAYEEQTQIKAGSTTEKLNIFNAAKFDEDDDAKSQCSNTSFRTRTDSSSIGDYESHTSDYDDEDDENDDAPAFIDEYVDHEDNDASDGAIDDDGDEDVVDDSVIQALEADDLLTDLPGLNLTNGEQFMYVANGAKQRTISTNTIGSDVDAANFDLAEFITKDDDLIANKLAPTTTKSTKAATKFVNGNNQNVFKQTQTKSVIAAQKFVIVENAADSDSDVIVDVETVEQEDVKKRVLLLKNSITVMPEDHLTFVDNVKADPEWNPKESKPKSTKSSAASTSTASPTTTAGKIEKPRSKLNAQKNQQFSNKTATKASNKKQILKCTHSNVQQTKYRHGIGKGGKNLALLKRDCESIEDNETKKLATKVDGKDLAFLKHDSHSINNNNNNNNKIVENNANCTIAKNNTNENIKNLSSIEPNPKIVETEKRKLNLDEYKRRFNNGGEDLKQKQQQKQQTATATPPRPILPAPANNQSPTKIQKPHSEAVTSIVKTLKEQQQQQQQANNEKIDPITLARNKVLRMQELKRAQQMKIIDSTISAKVPKVTKLLPLQELIKDAASYHNNNASGNDKCEKTTNKGKSMNTNNLDNHPEYEKIVMVSVACNTALTFTPNDKLPNVPMLEHIRSATDEQNVKISNNSLISSIQHAVVKQSLPKIEAVTNTNNAIVAQTQQQQQQHGEDKIIMHLRKDRIRDEPNNNTHRSIEIQTDFQAAFPTLPLPKFIRKLRHSRRKYRRRQHETDGNNSTELENSSQSDNDATAAEGAEDVVKNNADYANSINGGSIAGYSSRSSRRHRSSVSSSYSESGYQHNNQRHSRSRNRRRKSMRSKSKRRSSSSSSTSSLSDYSARSRSRSRSGRRNRTRSRSPYYERRDDSYGDRNVLKPAVEERRIVYVGRIEEETTKEMLRRKFLAYGSIRQITIHYKENGLKYGFVTFDRSEDAFAVIDSSTRDAQINMYDISFGGRRAFCRTTYADLDNAGINNYHSYVFPQAAAPVAKQEDSFEALLKKVKAKLDASKSSTTTLHDKP